MAIDIEGPLNVERLRDGVRTIVDRHEALRTRFVEEGGELFQVVEDSLVLELSVFTLDTTTDNDRSIQMQEIGRTFSIQPFDLESGPLLRIGLIKRSSTHHRFLFAVHHLVFDGGSWPVLVNELLSLYGGEMLAPVEMQYRSYVEWQDQLTETGKWADAARHWSYVAAAEPANFDMILDRSRCPSMSLDAGVYSHLLPETLVDALRDVSKHAGSTLFKTLFAAFCVLLHKLSDTRDVVVRSTLTGRAREEVEQGIGYYVNTTVVRAQVSRGTSFLEIVRQITRKFDDAVENEAFLFEGVCKRIEELAHLIDVSVANVSLTKMPAPLERKVGSTRFSDARTFLEAGPSDLAVYSQEVAGRIRLTSVFRRGVFEDRTIAWLMRCFQTLVENSVRDVGLHVADLKLLRDEDRGKLDLARNLIEPGTPFETFPAEAIERPIADRFHLQVDRVSQNFAVVTRQNAWRYGELSTKANGVCAALAPYLAGSSNNVALLFEHGAPMIAALLGVLKSGAAYVPLETSMPAERLKGIVNDCEARVLVTDGGMVELARQLVLPDGYIVNVDELANGETLEKEPVINPGALAYILYTSGSTGVPKGVVQNHRNVLYHAKTYANALHLNPKDRISFFSGYGFDASVMDIFGVLLNGATSYPCDVRNESVADIVRWLFE